MIGRVHLLPAHHKTEFLKRSREGFHHERRQVPPSNLAILRQINELHPAYPLSGSSMLRAQRLDLPRTGPRIADLADVDSEKWRSYADVASWPMRLIYHLEWQKVAALERRIAHECDYSTFVSEAEAALFRSLIPERAEHIKGISSGVDHRYFDPSPGFEAPFDASVPTFVFTGTMDYPPNVDAVRWFAQEILPIIRRTLPAAAFFIVGNSPSPAVLALASIPGVHVTGRVPDVRPYLAHATAGVAPMRIARGIQNKVLEAMAMARPVVVTSGALEGIEATPGEDVILADDVAGFAAAAYRVAHDPGWAAALGRAARARVVGSYDWSVRLRAFDGLLGALG